SLGQRMPVAAIGAGHVIVRPQGHTDPDRDGFLSGIEMRRPVHLPGQEQAMYRVLELPDQVHATVSLEEHRGSLALVHGLGLGHPRFFGLLRGLDLRQPRLLFVAMSLSCDTIANVCSALDSARERSPWPTRSSCRAYRTPWRRGRCCGGLSPKGIASRSGSRWSKSRPIRRRSSTRPTLLVSSSHSMWERTRPSH